MAVNVFTYSIFKHSLNIKRKETVGVKMPCAGHVGTGRSGVLLIINLDSRWQWFSFMSRSLYSRRQIAPYQLNRIWMDPRVYLEFMEDRYE
jgi:hypothetical protein